MEWKQGEHTKNGRNRSKKYGTGRTKAKADHLVLNGESSGWIVANDLGDDR